MSNGRGGFIGQDGLNAPSSPKSVSGTAGDQQVSVAFTAPTNVGASAITGYVVTSNNGIGAAGSSSPITVTGLTNGTSYTFNVWAINAFGYSAPSDASGSVSPVEPSTALFAHGTTGSYQNTITTLSITTLGSSSDFGDLTVARSSLAAVSSSTRGVFFSGYDGTRSNVIDYVTIASAGNATDFGDASVATNYPFGTSNSTRGVFHLGYSGSYLNTLEYITIASTGNATDFGDSTTSAYQGGATSSSTRACYAGGYDNGSRINVIDYITIASTGNATDFGDLIEATANIGTGNCSSGTYGYFVGGRNASGTILQTIQYITIASTGNASDYGDLSVGKRQQGQASNTSRGLSIAGRSSTTNYTTSVEYFSLATSGSGASWGDLSTAGYAASALSDSHGGLS